MISNILFSIRRLDPHLESKVRVLVSQNLENFGNRHGLTTMQKRLLPLLVEGVSRVEMARLCAVSPETVKTHVGNIYKKCRVGSQRELYLNLATLSARSCPSPKPDPQPTTCRSQSSRLSSPPSKSRKRG
jgi:DNA-binding CsgD family transcriptional regulator